MATSLEPMPFDASNMAVEPGQDEYDSRFEFDAPRFYDFKSGSPRGEELDTWFHTSATKGLATPEGAYAYAGPGNQQEQQVQQQQASPVAEALPTLQPQQQQPPQQQQLTADAQQEAEQVRAALAHITGNPNLKLGATAKATKKSASKSASKSRIQASNNDQNAAGAAPQRQTRTQAAGVSPKPTTTKKTEMPAAAASKPAAKQTRSGAAGTSKAADMPAVQSKPAASTKAVVISARPTSPKKKLRSETTTTAATSQQQPRMTRAGATKAPKHVKAAALPPKPVTRGVQKKKQAPAAATKRPTSAKTRGITVPHSPLLLSKHRGALHQQRQQQMKTTEEMEMEEVARGKREADRLRRQNAKSVKSVLTRQPKPVKHSTKPLTEPVAVNLRTSMRNREHGMETRSMLKKPAPKSRTSNKTTAAFKRPVSSTSTGVTKKRAAPATRPKLTLPRTPNFATKARLRPSRYKPTEEEELDKLKNLPKFKARAVGKNVLNGKAVLQGHRGPTKAPTVPEPFNFKTDARAAKRPAPQPEQPAPFVFGSDKGRKGRVTRSRANSASVAAAGTAGTASTSGVAVDGGRKTTRQTRPRPVSASSSEPEEQQQEQPVSLKRRRVTGAGPFLQGGALRVVVQKQATGTEEEEEHEPQQKQQRRQVPADDDDSEEMDVDSGDGMQEVFRGRRGSGRAVMHNPLFNAN